jgi:hypothetical protein
MEKAASWRSWNAEAIHGTINSDPIKTSQYAGFFLSTDF